MKANEIRAVYSQVDPDVEDGKAFQLFVEAVAQLAEIADQLEKIEKSLPALES